MIVVTYHKKTNIVISVCPVTIESEHSVELIEEDGIVHNNYDYMIFNGTEPLFYNDSDGNLCLDTNRVLLEKGYLDAEEE